MFVTFMVKQTITIINKLGFHARAAAKFVNTASRYESDVYLICNERRADGKSIMSIMMLAAPQGTPIDLEVEGKDEQEVMNVLVNLINNRFEEEE
jgi:phosphocarrier protein